MRIFIACVVSTLALMGVVAAYGEDDKQKDEDANLLVNGSFEEGPDTGDQGWKPLDKGSKAIKGWEVTRGQIDFINGYWEAADGKKSLDLHGSPGYGGVKQAFKTKKGQKYRVSFSLAGNPIGTAPIKTLGVKVADKEEEFTFSTEGKSNSDMGWATQVLNFTATAAETTIELYTLMKEDPNCGPALDNVSVVLDKD
jgi:choice-of-anchor C domain-containing protein